MRGLPAGHDGRARLEVLHGASKGSRRLGRLMRRLPVPPGRSKPVEPRLPLPTYVFTYHKTGVVLFTKVFGDIARAFGWQRIEFTRWTNEPPPTEIAHFMHSLVGPRVLERDFRGVHVVRDPRNIAVSGYAYHRRCRERW